MHARANEGTQLPSLEAPCRARRLARTPVAGLRTRGRVARAYRPSLPRPRDPVLRWRLSFPLTAAGQSRFPTGFPLASPARCSGPVNHQRGRYYM